MLDRLLLVRHGEVRNPDHVVYADLPGFGLSEAGEAQARAAAGHLAGEPVHQVLSSPLRRAVETARPVASALGCAVTTDALLTEWRLSGRWAPARWEDVPQKYPGELEAYLDTPADLPFAPEGIHDVARRIRSVVGAAGRRHPGGTVVLVSHQDPIQAIRLDLTGRPLSDLNVDKPGHAAIIDLRRDGPAWAELSVWHPAVAGASPFPPS